MSEASPTRSSGRWPLIWTIVLACAGGGGVLLWGLAGVFFGDGLVGDGFDPETYGVDLSQSLIDPAAMVATGNPRGFLPTYESPETLPGDEVAEWNASNSRKWQKEVVSTDRVVGVEINGESRAYPLFIVDAHEVVLDEIGGVPIVIARSPLIDETSVFHRRLSDGSEPDFEVSGLLDDLALLMNDGEPEASLWSAHDGRAIAGPAVGSRLEAIAGASVVRWRDWLAAHPDTQVAVRDPGSMRRYRRIDYRRYLDGDEWLMSPRREPEASSLPGRDRVVSVLDPDGSLLAVMPIAEMSRFAIDDRTTVEIEGRRLVFEPDPGGNAVDVVESDGIITRFGMWAGTWVRDPVAATSALDRGRAALAGASLDDDD